MVRVLDFDRARNERRNPTVLRAFGEDHRIPSSPPVGFVLLAAQLSRDKTDDDTYGTDELGELLAAAVGAVTYNRLLELGLEPQDIELLIEMVGAAWRSDDEDGDGEGEAPAPEAGAGSST